VVQALDGQAMNYCIIRPREGVQHVVPHFDFGCRCMCGRTVYVLTDHGGELRDAPTRERLSALVRFQTAARKANAARNIWETRLFC
jgi:hypothetical protein